jgi:hypothetical protein
MHFPTLFYGTLVELGSGMVCTQGLRKKQKSPKNITADTCVSGKGSHANQQVTFSTTGITAMHVV